MYIFMFNSGKYDRSEEYEEKIVSDENKGKADLYISTDFDYDKFSCNCWNNFYLLYEQSV